MVRRLSQEQLIAIARLRFEPINVGQQSRPLEKIKELLREHPEQSIRSTLGNMDKADLSVALRQAVQNRLIRVDVGEQAGSALESRNGHLERKLLDRFARRGLRTVIVVASTPDRQTSDSDDGVSRQLGEVFGGFLADSRLIRFQHRIAVGCGRAVFHACRQIERRRSVREDRLTLCSLSGSFGKRSERANNYLVDADDNAAAFARGCILPCVYEKVGALAIIPRDVAKAGLLAKTWMESPSKDLPSAAIVGAGVLTHQWSFYEALGSEPEPQFQALMKRLVSLALRISKQNTHVRPRFVPVGDVACHLVRLHDAAARVAKADEGRLDRLIAQINARLLTPPYEILAGTELWLLAGGEAKARAVQYALEHFTVDSLTTDRACADALLELEAAGNARASAKRGQSRARPRDG